jgi:hypothetical protein
MSFRGKKYEKGKIKRRKIQDIEEKGERKSRKGEKREHKK